MHKSFKAVVILETGLSWVALVIAAACAFFAFSPTPEDFSSPAVGYAMAAAFAAAAALFHFSAGHLERKEILLAPLHLVPFALVGLAMAVPRIAA